MADTINTKFQSEKMHSFYIIQYSKLLAILLFLLDDNFFTGTYMFLESFAVDALEEFCTQFLKTEI